MSLRYNISAEGYAISVYRQNRKTGFGQAIAKGNHLSRQVTEENVDQSKKEAEEWGQKTHDLIVAAYGNGEAELFLDDSGYTFFSDGTEKARNWLDGRLRRTSELLRRIDTMTPRPDFDPAKFK